LCALRAWSERISWATSPSTTSTLQNALCNRLRHRLLPPLHCHPPLRHRRLRLLASGLLSLSSSRMAESAIRQIPPSTACATRVAPTLGVRWSVCACHPTCGASAGDPIPICQQPQSGSSCLAVSLGRKTSATANRWTNTLHDRATACRNHLALSSLGTTVTRELCAARRPGPAYATPYGGQLVHNLTLHSIVVSSVRRTLRTRHCTPQ